MSLTLFSIVGLAFAISLIVLFHEAGHYLTARMAGVAVTEFAIGMGPKIVGTRRDGTDFTLRAIPIGGFCELVGMEENPEATPEERAVEFAGKSAPWRMAMLFGGSFMNFVLAFLLFFAVNAFFGQSIQPLAAIPTVAKVTPGSPAERAGLLPGDEILKAGGAPVTSWFQFRALIERSLGKPTPLLLRRGGQELEITVTPEAPGAFEPEKGRIGVVAARAPVLGEIFGDSPAEHAGLRAGDRVLTIDGRAVNRFEEFEAAVEAAAKGRGGELLVRVKRGTAEIEARVAAPMPESGVRPPYAALIGDTAAGSPAERAGVKPGDLVAEVDGEPILSWHHMVAIFSANAGRTLAVTLETPETGARRTVALAPRDAGDGVGRVGVTIRTEYGEPLGVTRGAAEAWRQTVDVTARTIEGLWKLIAGALSLDSVSGPVGIAKIVGQQMREGFTQLLGVTALLSINIGLINLFPIPGLDGSRILFVALEVVRRRKLSTKIEEAIHAAGLALLVLLLILVTWKDVMKLVR